MSEKNIIFVMPNNAYMPNCLGGYGFDEVTGYLKHISDQEETLKYLKRGAISGNNTDLHFPGNNPGDKETIEAFCNTIKRLSERREGIKEYHFFVAEVLDPEKLEEDLLLIQETYPELLYECYNNIPPETE